MENVKVNGNVKETVKTAAAAKAAEVKKVDSVELVGKVVQEMRQDFISKKDRAVAVITVKHPFDEFEPDIELVIWDKGRKGKFDYIARKALNALPDGVPQEIAITGQLELINLVNTLKRTSFPCASISINSPFDDSNLIVKFANKEISAAVTMIAQDFMNIVAERTAKSKS